MREMFPILLRVSQCNLSLVISMFIFICGIFGSISALDDTDPGIEMTVNDDEWDRILGANRPPGDDDYLYVTGPNAKMNIVYTNPSKENCETNGIEISLRVWANWNRTKFPVIKEGTELFRIAIMPCHRSMPATKFFRFDDFNPNEWDYQPYTASREGEFNFKCDKRVDIEVSDNDDYSAKITADDRYTVAIKDLHMRYFCVVKGGEPLYANETCDEFETQIRCVDVICSKNSCPPSFSITGGSWSSQDLPPRDGRYVDFWYTREDLKTFSIQIKERIDSMACLTIGYWITGQGQVSIEIDSAIINLQAIDTRITDEPNVTYQWRSLVLCPRQFTQRSNSSDSGSEYSSVLFRSHIMAPDDELVALSLTPTNNYWESRYKSINNYLHHFSHPESAEEWFVLPPFLQTSLPPPKPFDIEVTFPKSTEGNVYIFSKWFKYSPVLKLRGNVKLDELFGTFSGTLSLHESNGKKLFSQNLFFLSPDSPAVSRLTHRLNNPLKAPVSMNLESETPCFVMITVKYNATKQSYLTLSDIDIGDGCRESEVVCRDHGTCINMEVDKYQCSCDTGWTGTHCEAINFCEIVDKETGLTGDDFCEQSAGTCDPRRFNQLTRNCDCGIMKYWKLIQPSRKTHPNNHDEDKTSPVIKGNCESVSKCVGLTDLCPVGWACDAELWSSEKPCQVCNRKMGYSMVDGQCILVDACSNQCGTAKCNTIGGYFYCYCDGDKELSEDGLSCQIRTTCNVWTSQLLGCSHTCELVNREAKCSCFEGYELKGDGKTCEPIFNCSTSCPGRSICASVNDGETFSSICTCPSGWDWDEVTSECVDICKLADQGNQEWQHYIQVACGNNRCQKIGEETRCICSPPIITNAKGLCELEKVCLVGNRGYIDCNARNALCEPRTKGLSATYRCLCPPGKAFENGHCVDQCGKKKHECAAMNAICSVVEDVSTNSPIAACVCRPGFIMEKNYCYLAQHSVKATFVAKILNTKRNFQHEFLAFLWESFCSNVNYMFLHDCHLYTQSVLTLWIKKSRARSLDHQIARYVDTILSPDVSRFWNGMIASVNLISWERGTDRDHEHGEKLKPHPDHRPGFFNPASGIDGPTDFGFETNSDFLLTVSLEMRHKPVGGPSLLQIMCEDVFNKEDPRNVYCLIPSQSMIRKGTIEESDLNPCSEMKIDYCSAETSCEPSQDETKFSCVCKPGYKVSAVLKQSRFDMKLTKQFCIDVDECEQSVSPCTSPTVCVNTIGSYKCVCEESYIRLDGKCVDLCQYQACQHGQCKLMGNHSAICICDPWHVGDKCEKINKVALFWRTMTIVAATIGSVIAAIFVAGSIIVARRSIKHASATISYQLSKSAAVENGYLKNRIELTESIYMQHIRPSLRSIGGTREPMTITTSPDLVAR